jgi:prepilin-type N-terminal cleavage/methylation domain-containing protein
MAISAIRPSRAEPGRRGFTLLEILLAMALLGFLVSLIVPRLDQIYLRFLFWLDQDRVEREIASLSGRAYLEGKALSLSSWPPPVPGSTAALAQARAAAASSEPLSGTGEPVRLTLPENWRVVVEPTILFRPDGACSGGEVAIEAGDIVRRFRLEAPRCRLAK